MKGPLAALLLAVPLLCAAAPLPLSLEPAEPTLGRPLRATVTLPDAETALVGLPALGSFELLAPPQREGSELRLLLLPMRPGRHTLPALPLHRGRTGQLSTTPLTVEVTEGVPAGDEPARLKSLPESDRRRAGQLWPLLALLAGAALALRLRRPGRQRSLERLDEAALLAELQRRLGHLPEGAPRRAELARRLELLRFAPPGATPDTPEKLLADVLAAAGEEA